MNRHSKANALLTRDWLDYTNEVAINVNVPAATGLTLAATYTVGAGVLSRLESARIQIENTTAASQVGASIRTNRNGTLRIWFDMLSIAGLGTFSRLFRDSDFELLPGDTVELYYNNADGGARNVQITAWFRETDS